MQDLAIVVRSLARSGDHPKSYLELLSILTPRTTTALIVLVQTLRGHQVGEGERFSGKGSGSRRCSGRRWERQLNLSRGRGRGRAGGAYGSVRWVDARSREQGERATYLESRVCEKDQEGEMVISGSRCRSEAVGRFSGSLREVSF